MPAQLLALSDGPSILLDKPILLLGRHPECDIQLNSRKVSRRHCCVAQVNDYLVVRDLGSTNGVRINGERIVEGKLRAGDELTVGNFRYRVAWDGSDAHPPPNVEPPKFATLPLADKDLENAEEPVELEESDAGPVPSAKPASPATTPQSEPGPSTGSTTSSSPSSHVLPDKLNLMPGSSFIGKPGSSPG